MNFCLRVWLLLEVVLKEDEGKGEHLTKRRKEPLSLQSYLQKKSKTRSASLLQIGVSALFCL